MRPARSFLAAGLATALLALGLLLGPGRPLEASTSAAEAAIQNAIARALEDRSLPPAFWGVYVQNLRTGEVLFSRNADMNLMPASNLKLLTTATALHALGPHHRYATRLYFEGEVEDSTLRGDLILRGAGDPSFGSALSGQDPLRLWARQLRALGVARIEGRIIGDASALGDEPYAEGWDLAHIATEPWAQAAGGLSYADNLVMLNIAGTRAGQPAQVTPEPAGYVSLHSSLSTRAGGGYNPIRLGRTVGTNEVRIGGSVSAGYRGSARLPIQDPTAFTLAAFAARLRQAGIVLEAEILDAKNLARPPRYESEPIFAHLSPPLVDILTEINYKSNNFYAEQVFRTFADNGRPSGGERRVRALMREAGVEDEGFSVRDGSGLSRKNLISAEAMGRLLAHMYRHPQREAFLGTLPRGGQPSTTMRYRLGGLPVRAKTGAIEHVRALSGYATAPDGTPYAFVLFVNNFTSRSALVSGAQNRIVEAIATGGRAGT